MQLSRPFPGPKEIAFTFAPIAIPPPVLPSREIGACVEFCGIVREIEEGEALAGLHYEAHESMARRQLERIFDELCAIHPCPGVVFHPSARLGVRRRGLALHSGSRGASRRSAALSRGIHRPHESRRADLEARFGEGTLAFEEALNPFPSGLRRFLGSET